MTELTIQDVFTVIDERLIAMGIAAEPVAPEAAAQVHALSSALASAHRRFELGPTRILFSGYFVEDLGPTEQLAKLNELGDRVKQEMALGVPVVPWVHSFSRTAVFFAALAESNTGTQAVLQKFLHQLFDNETMLPALARLERIRPPARA